MDKIEFDEATHTYRVDGAVLPSVTQIMSTMGLVRPYTGDPWYGERGTAVHTACDLLDEDRLDFNSVDPQIAGFVSAYQKFRQETEFQWQHMEYSLSHPIYRYCGRLDRLSEGGVILDIKTGDSDPIQLEGYRELVLGNMMPVHREGYFLKLNEDGTYKLQAHKYDRKLLGVFLSAATVWWYRKGRGLL